MYAPPAPEDLLDAEEVKLSDGSTLRGSDGTPLVASLYRSPYSEGARRIIVRKGDSEVFDPGASFDFDGAMNRLQGWVDDVVQGEVTV